MQGCSGSRYRAKITNNNNVFLLSDAILVMHGRSDDDFPIELFDGPPFHFNLNEVIEVVIDNDNADITVKRCKAIEADGLFLPNINDAVMLSGPTGGLLYNQVPFLCGGRDWTK